MSFVVTTNSQEIFNTGGDFHVDVKLSYTIDEIKRKFTVTVDGVRAYCNYAWNFTTFLKIGLGTSKSDAQNDSNIKTGSLPYSGSNTYEGYIPKNGTYNKAVTLSRTFNYKDDGTVPNVYIYIKGYNSGVYYIYGGYNISANTNITTNIQSNISSISPIEPIIVANKVSESLNGGRLAAKVTNNVTIDRWEVTVSPRDNTDDEPVYTEYISTSLDKTYIMDRDVEYWVWVRARKKGTTQWSDSVKLVFDCRKPNIINANLIPQSSNKALLQFKSNHSCNYKVISGSLQTGLFGPINADTLVSKTLDVHKNCTENYILYVYRKDNSSLYNEITLPCNTQEPVVKITTADILGNVLHLIAETDIPCTEWTVKVMDNDTIISTQQFDSADNKRKLDINIGNLDFNRIYTVTISVKNPLSGLTKVDSVTDIKCQNCARIYINEQYVPTSIMIYNSKDKQWHHSIPYVYDKTKWVECI